MQRSAEWSRKAHEVNDRVLDLLVADRVSELYAFTLFVNPEQPASVLRYLPLPGDRWVHRVYPPIPLSPAVAAGLRENDHDLHASCSDDHIRTVLVKIGSLEAEVKHNQKVQDQLDTGVISVWQAANQLLPKRFAASELDGKREVRGVLGHRLRARASPN